MVGAIGTRGGVNKGFWPGSCLFLQQKDWPVTLSPVVEVRDWWFVVDVGQLDSGPRDGNVLVLELPTYGALRYAQGCGWRAMACAGMGGFRSPFRNRTLLGRRNYPPCDCLIPPGAT